MGQTEEYKNKNLYYLSHGNVHRVYVFNKSERIATAIFLLAHNVKNDLLFRNTLTAQALLLLEEALKLVCGTSEHQFEMRMTNLVATLSIGKGTFLSVSNVVLLLDECYALLTFLKEKEWYLSQNSLLDSQFFTTTDVGILEKTVSPWREEMVSSLTEGHPQIKGHAVSFNAVQKRKTAITPKTDVFESKHGDRQKKILNAIGKKGVVTIKDLLSAVPECSLKTIQRELATLVHEGVLTKEGERRWSTYRLSQ